MRKIAATRPLRAVIQIIGCFRCHMGQISYQILFWMRRKNCSRLTWKQHSEATGRKRNEALIIISGGTTEHMPAAMLSIRLTDTFQIYKHAPAPRGEHHYWFRQVLLLCVSDTHLQSCKDSCRRDRTPHETYVNWWFADLRELRRKEQINEELMEIHVPLQVFYNE